MSAAEMDNFETRGLRILAVEDSATQAAALAVVLESEGYEVVLANTDASGQLLLPFR